MSRTRALRALFVLVACASLAATAALAAGPYYARGSYYVGTAGQWGADAGNMLYDDGTHGDVIAGDNVHEADVVSDMPPGIWEFKLANADWTENWPKHPVYLMDNARLITTAAGAKIHFRLDLNSLPGWQPVQGAVACDHAMLPGTPLELMGSAPELGSWNTPVPAVDDNGVWTTVVHVATPGSYQFKFRIVGDWACPYGLHYNMLMGDNFTFTTTVPGTAVRFLFNPADGRGYAGEFDDTPARPSTWGRVKALYR